MKEIKEKANVTGLDTAANRKEAEYDLVESLLKASEFRTSEDNITEADIKRDGKVLFTVRLHPIGETEARQARKKATTYMPNPNGKKLPPIEKEFNATKFSSWLIYLATVEEDQKNIWGNPAIMSKFNIIDPVDTIDILLMYGEKDRLSNLVGEISGMVDDEDPDAETQSMDEVDYAKN